MPENLTIPLMCDHPQNQLGRNAQYTFNSVILTIFIVSLSFACSFAISAFFKEWFDRMTPKNEELQAKFNYMFLIFAFSIVLVFILIYNLEGSVL